MAISLKNFTKNLINGNIIGAAKSLFNPPPFQIDPSKYTTPDGQNGWFFETTHGQYSYFKYNGYASAVDAYNRCPPVSAIINRKAQAFVNGKIWILEVDDDKVSEKPAAKEMARIMQRPNPLQSWKDFEAQLYIYMQLFGFAICLPIKPFGFKDKLATSSMWNIPAHWIDFDATQEKFNANGGIALTEIVITYNGVTTILQISDLIIIRDFTPSFHNHSFLTFPGSKLNAVDYAINNVIGAYESRNVLINYRGALGILSGDGGTGQYTPIPMTKDQKETLQRDFKRYGLKNRQFQVILTSAQLKWQQMGYATKDLMLMEEVQESTIQICGNLNFPPFILGLAKTTYNNMDAAEKDLYQNATIPDAESIYEQLSDWFELKAKYGIYLSKDYSHIPVLQEDKESQGRAMSYMTQSLDLQWKNDWITLNRVLELLGEDTLKTGGDIYYSQWLEQHPTTPALTKMLSTVQYREPDGRFSGMTAYWDSRTPFGTNLQNQQ